MAGCALPTAKMITGEPQTRLFTENPRDTRYSSTGMRPLSIAIQNASMRRSSSSGSGGDG